MTESERERAVASVVYLGIPPTEAKRLVAAGIDLGFTLADFKDDEKVGELMQVLA